MKKDQLVINTNPHLRDPKARATAVCRMVETSFAVENIHVKIKATENNSNYQFSSTVQSRGKK